MNRQSSSNESSPRRPVSREQNRTRPVQRPDSRKAPAPARPLTPEEKAKAEARKQRREKLDRTRKFIGSNTLVRYRSGIDRPMLVIILLLLCFGSVMVFSASYAFALKNEGDSYYYIKRQLMFAVIGLLIMGIVSMVDYRVVRFWTPLVFVGVAFLLAITPFWGISKGEATRWIIIGPLRFQPSEMMKPMLVLMLAWYYAKYQNSIIRKENYLRSSKYSLFIPFAIVGFVCFLIAIENHLSGMIIMFLLGLSVIWMGGANKIWFGLAGGIAVVAVMVVLAISEYARTRLDVWLHPENYSSLDETWQTLNGLYAVGSGGFFGVGLGNSRQKHLYVSEPQNDFIFSIICEELGMVGAMMVIVLFVLFVWRGYTIAMRAPDTFSSLTVMGLVAKVAIQATLNMWVVTAMLPNTGISLPFFSYGGTALMVQLAEMGLLLGISRYSSEDTK